MKRFIVLTCLLLACNLLFAEEEILYQKQHNNLYNLTVVTFVKSAEDWYYISIIIAENTDAVDKYVIYHTKQDVLQALLFQFEKDNYYKERIEKMNDNESLLFLKENTDIKENVIFNTKSYLYLK
jgi:hypothetical protein